MLNELLQHGWTSNGLGDYQKGDYLLSTFKDGFWVFDMFARKFILERKKKLGKEHIPLLP